MSEPYTVLRVTKASGVPLFEGHVRRLGESSRGALRHFASETAAGIYRVTWDGKQLTTLLRPASRLVEGMSTRFVVSPFADQRGRFAKPSPPNLYDAVRIDGVSSLLTDRAGEELYEACVASIVAWDGKSLVLPPEEVPAVASLAEAEVAAKLPVRRARLMIAGDWPLLLINAVAGTCQVQVPGRADFPRGVRGQVDAVFNRSPVDVAREP